MATDLSRIQTIRTQTLTLLESLTTNPKPNYSVEGRSVSWGDYMKQLTDTIAWCDSQQSGYEIGELLTQGYT